MRPSTILLSLFLLPLQLYKYARFTILCDCGLLQDTLVNVFKHPWYSGYSDYAGLIDPYGFLWWAFHAPWSYSLGIAVMALVAVDSIFLLTLRKRLSWSTWLVLFFVDLAVFYTAPVDLFVFWLLALGVVYTPLFSLLALLAKIPLWPAPFYYLQYVLHGPLSHLTLLGSWRYFLFLVMFGFGWILAWINGLSKSS